MLLMAMDYLPAQAAIMNMNKYNGRCACHLYKTEGTANGQHYIHRCWSSENHKERTYQDQINFVTNATQKQPAMVGEKRNIYKILVSLWFLQLTGFTLQII